MIILCTSANGEVKLQLDLIQSGSPYSFLVPGGKALLGRKWTPIGAKPAAVLVAVHGTQTHSGWFGGLAVEMSHHGWAVSAPDRDGSGLNLAHHDSGLPKAFDGEHWLSWLKWLDAAVGHAVSAHPDVPVYLLGSSWSTALVTAYMDAQPSFKSNWQPKHPALLAGLILSVPSGLVSHVPGRVKKAEVLAMSALGILLPPLKRLSTSIGIPADTYSDNPDVQGLIADQDIPLPILKPEPPLQRGSQDPRIIHRATYAFMYQSALMRRAALKALPRLRPAPLLVVLTEVDRIADNAKLGTLFPAANVVTIPQTQHAIQVERPDLLAAEILRWTSR